MLPLISVVVSVALMLWVFGQVRKPTGPLGRRFVKSMNLTHSGLTDWGLERVVIGADATILDVGCGGGRTLQKLAAHAPRGTVHGIDYSAASVAASRDTNAREIEAGRVQVQLGSVAALPFPERTFDLVTAVETHYYWPDLPADLREVLRVLRPGGTLALIAETHRDGWRGALYSVPMLLIRAKHLSDAEIRALLTRAGFAEVSTVQMPGKNWICATARRPSSAT